jgi:hypothetical protein
VTLIAGCTAKPKRWVELKSPEGRFKVLLPENPSHGKSKDGKEHRYTVVDRNGTRVLRVCYEPNFDKTITLDDRIQGLGKLAGIQGKITQRPLKLGKHSGIEAVYEIKEDGDVFEARHRVYHAKTTSYQVIAMVLKGHDTPEDVERFFNSFQILGE